MAPRTRMNVADEVDSLRAEMTLMQEQISFLTSHLLAPAVLLNAPAPTDTMPSSVSPAVPTPQTSRSPSAWSTPRRSAPHHTEPYVPPFPTFNPYLPLCDPLAFPPLDDHVQSNPRPQSRPKPKPNQNRPKTPPVKSPTKSPRSCTKPETPAQTPAVSPPPSLPKDERKKIVLIGDSHVRYIAGPVQQKMGPKVAVTSSFLPGAPAETFIRLAKEAAGKLEPQDVLVLIGGSNDIEAETYPAKLKDALPDIKQKIFISQVPLRYDKPQLNQAIDRVNKGLQVLAGEHPQVTIIPTSQAPRHAYTKHGLHLNDYGKRLLCSEISETLASFLG